ncbi:MAG: outer membrane protein assembly factor BamD [Pseudomonadota bacterium]|nr:outer membrane protein assembly factor BamD [Pseudomonadota bacterium]
MNITKFYAIAIVLLFLFGCQSETQEDISQKQANYLFESAKKDIEHKKYKTAVKSLEDIQINYPQYAEYDLLLYYLAKSQFENKDYVQAQDNAHEYITSYPATSLTEEMYYIEAKSQFLIGDDWLLGKFLSARHLRDTDFLEKSKVNFKKFLKKYPNSKYKHDVNESLIKIEDILATSELEIAEFNYRHKAYLGAIHRAETVIKQYPNSKQYQQAIKIMDNSFDEIGLKEEYKELYKLLQSAKA